MTRRHELATALMKAQAGGFPATPHGIDGEPALGIAGLSGVPRARIWDAVVSARCSDLTCDTVTFVVLEDGTVVVEEDVPDGSLEPLADAVEEILDPPYHAAAIRRQDEVWTCVAEHVRIVELPRHEGDVVDLTRVAGER